MALPGLWLHDPLDGDRSNLRAHGHQSQDVRARLMARPASQNGRWCFLLNSPYIRTAKDNFSDLPLPYESHQKLTYAVYRDAPLVAPIEQPLPVGPTTASAKRVLSPRLFSAIRSEPNSSVDIYIDICRLMECPDARTPRIKPSCCSACCSFHAMSGSMGINSVKSLG